MRRNTNKFLTGAALVVAAFSLSSCSIGTRDPIVAGNVEISDPLENANRAIFAFNEVVDDAIINPVIEGYRTVVPDGVRTGFSNFLRNLKTPIRFANQLLQGDIDGAGDELFRGIVNTFGGLGGLLDVAGWEGHEHEPEDFGQTLATWGVGHGPYVVVPFVGPSSLRDYAGYAVDAVADPVRLYLFNTGRENTYYARMGADYLDLRESLIDVLKDLESSSIDYYAATRATYFQNRQALIEDQDPELAVTPSIPDYDDDF